MFKTYQISTLANKTFYTHKNYPHKISMLKTLLPLDKQSLAILNKFTEIIHQ